MTVIDTETRPLLTVALVQVQFKILLLYFHSYATLHFARLLHYNYLTPLAAGSFTKCLHTKDVKMIDRK